MAENVGTVYYTVDAKTDPLVQSGREAEKQLDRTTAAMGKTDTAANKLGATSRKAANDAKGFGKALDDAGKQAASAVSSLNPLALAISAVISVESIRRIQQTAEEFTLLNARVTRLSADSQTAANNYQQLLNIANRTGTGLGDTVKLWENLTMTLRDLGGTDAQVLRLTETLQKIGTIGGSSGQEMSDALRQFGQGLSAGILRAEEFNSIIEQMPQLAREIAKGLGVPFGELRQLLLDGKLTAESVLGAIQKRTADVDAEFAKLPRTVSQAATALANDFGAAVSTLDRAVKASQTLAYWMDLVGIGVRDFTGNRTDIEQFNKLVKERADLTGRVARAQGNAIAMQSAEVTGASARIEAINKEIKAIQDRRVEQMKAAQTPIAGGSGPEGDAQSLKALETLKRQATLAKLSNEERAKAEAIAKLGAGATQAEKDQAAALAVEIFKANEAKKEGVKLTKQQTTEAEKLAAAQVEGTQQNEQVIAALSQALAQAGLKAQDLAEAQAVMRLNPHATPQQIQQVKDLADAIYQAEQAEIAHAEKMKQLEEQRRAAQSAGNQLIMDGLNALEQQGTQALSGLIAGTTSWGDAWRSTLTSVLNQGIGALVKLGVEQLKLFVMGQTQQAAATGTAAASGAAMAASYAPAAAAASVASFGSAAASGLAALAGAVPAMIGLFGGRAQGGPVQAGGMYRINETGQPEVFQAANGRQYMLPNSRGEVISNREATSGGAAWGGGVTVNVIEDASRGGQQQQRQNADGTATVDVFVASIRNDGPAAQAIEAKYGLTPVGS